jgi:hypothetical protein
MANQEGNDDQQKPLLDRLLNGGSFVLGIFTGLELLVLSYLFLYGSEADYWSAFGNLLSAAVPFAIISLVALLRGNSWRALMMME